MSEYTYVNQLDMEKFQPKLNEDLNEVYAHINSSSGREKAERICDRIRLGVDVITDYYPIRFTRPNNFREAMMDMAVRINQMRTDEIYLHNLSAMMEPWRQMTQKHYTDIVDDAFDLFTKNLSECQYPDSFSALIRKLTSHDITSAMKDFFRRVDGSKMVTISYDEDDHESAISTFFREEEYQLPDNIRLYQIQYCNYLSKDAMAQLRYLGKPRTIIRHSLETYPTLWIADVPKSYTQASTPLEMVQKYLSDHEDLVNYTGDGKILLYLDNIILPGDLIYIKDGVNAIQQWMNENHLDQFRFGLQCPRAINICGPNQKELNLHNRTDHQYYDEKIQPQIHTAVQMSDLFDGRYFLRIRGNMTEDSWNYVIDDLDECKFFRLEKLK